MFCKRVINIQVIRNCSGIPCPICSVMLLSTQRPVNHINANSGFPSLRTNLSPFTKDFRGGEQLNEFINQFFVALPFGGAHKKCK